MKLNKTLILSMTLLVSVSFSACSLTDEQKMFWAGAMHGAGQNMSNAAAEMRQKAHEQSLQPVQMPQRLQTNCTTTYSPLFKQYETVCQ